MASEYRIHRPYVLASLPRPLDHTDGRIVARQVYGQRDDQRKRKRTELAVGVDGETASIYDESHPWSRSEWQHLWTMDYTCYSWNLCEQEAMNAKIWKLHQ